MRSFVLSQLLVYLLLVCPGPLSYRYGLILFWVWACHRAPIGSLLGSLWQLYTLWPYPSHWSAWSLLHPSLTFQCEQRFWFICTSQAVDPIVTYLMATRLGEAATELRNWVERFCIHWHPLWGQLAFSLVMGGRPEAGLKSLYRNLGFLHVLVISGSQFSLLSKWLKNLCRWPVTVCYALALIDWRWFRPLTLLVDAAAVVGLLIYLLACGASPPCQRAFLEQCTQFLRRWVAPPRVVSPAFPYGGLWVLQAQALLFPTQWFSLSNLLSWGAVQAIKAFGSTRSYAAQLRTSIGIQLLSLAMFGRLSLAALLFDFLVSPIWDILLFVCLAGIFIPVLRLQAGMISALDLFHECLWDLDRWQGVVFGSSALSFRLGAAAWGQLAAALIFLWLFWGRLPQVKLSR